MRAGEIRGTGRCIPHGESTSRLVGHSRHSSFRMAWGFREIPGSGQSGRCSFGSSLFFGGSIMLSPARLRPIAVRTQVLSAAVAASRPHKSCRRLAVPALLAVLTLTLHGHVRASDHGDTRENVARIGSDMTDVFIFPSKEAPETVVLATTVHPLITPDQVDRVFFDPGLLIQFKIDTTGDFVEDRVIQFRFVGYGAGQRVLVAGPSRPLLV